jgi:multidrug transporter EmrE-like cation transporter
MNLLKILKNFDWKLAIIILLLIGCEAVGQTLLEKASLEDNNNLLVIGGVVLYAIVGYIYYIALSSNISLAIVNIIWQAATILIITLISVFYFKQKLTNKEIIGIVIVAIGSMFFAPTEEAAIGGVAIGGADAKITNIKDRERLFRAKYKNDIDKLFN